MNRFLIASLVISVIVLPGCSQPAEPPPSLTSEAEDSIEQDFATQAAVLRAGQGDRIQIEATPIGDDELKTITGLEKLEVLLLDHPSNPIGADGFSAISSLPNLIHLRLRGVKVDDQAAASLGRIAGLQILNLPQSDLTDTGLAALTKLENLVQLRIGSSQLTDEGLKALAQFPKLKRVHLIDVPITDRGLAVFHDLPKLESLYIDGAQPSDAAYERLFQAQPGLHVHVDQAHHDRDPHAHPH